MGSGLTSYFQKLFESSFLANSARKRDVFDAVGDGRRTRRRFLTWLL